MEKVSIGIILGGKSYGVFKNDNDEYCQVSSFYIKDTQKFHIIYSSGVCGEIDKKNAVSTTSKKKVIKIISDGGFKLQ